MKLAVIGVGGAGGRLVDRFLEAERRLDRPCCGRNVFVFDTSQPALDALETVPSDRRVPIGDTYPGVDLQGVGVDGDAKLGAAVTKEERHEIRRALDDLEVYKADAVVVLAGLGGGTGTGGGAVLLEEFQTIYDTPVYAVATLPSGDESGERSLNAARGLQSFVRTADNVLLFDNDAWYPEVAPDEEDAGRRGIWRLRGRGGNRSGEDEDGDGPPWTPKERRTMNEVLATRLVSLFGAGEFEGEALPESAVDTSDLMRTLSTGGVSTIGRATFGQSGGFFARLRALFSRSGDDDTVEAVEITELVQRALDSLLTVPCDVSSAERVMFVLSGPPKKFSRRGFENAVYWLEDETGAAEVLAGDEPRTDTAAVTATILLSNVADVPRIDALHEDALASSRPTAGGHEDDAARQGDASVAGRDDADALTEPPNRDD